MVLSLFDLFQIGIGPSSSHINGPMNAAYEFASRLFFRELMFRTSRIEVRFFGPIAWSGPLHHTDRAILLGLSGEQPEFINVTTIGGILALIRERRQLSLRGLHSIPFHESRDVVYCKEPIQGTCSNRLNFRASNAEGQTLTEATYFITSGGSVFREDERTAPSTPRKLPHPFRTAMELLETAEKRHRAIWELVLENEMASHTEEEILNHVNRLWKTMQQSMARGLETEGLLPGGRGVKRSAPACARRLQNTLRRDPLHGAMDWLDVWATAVSEENAAGGRIVAAPTCGASGVFPAVANYYLKFMHGNQEGLGRFFLAATAIGSVCLQKDQPLGCQAAIGVASAMAAAGLASATGGTNEQITRAAELALDEYLGMTCDAVGPVQNPCIERNARGARRAVHSVLMAVLVRSDKIALDRAIRTAGKGAAEMQSRYKVRSPGLLPVGVVEC